MSLIRNTLLSAAIALLVAPAVSLAAGESVVKIKNDSEWVITQLYLSAVDDEEWGPDQLGEHMIESGGSFSLHGVPCDIYDVRLVDEDEDVCVVGGVKLCSEKAAWHITDKDLLTCQAVTEE